MRRRGVVPESVPPRWRTASVPPEIPHTYPMHDERRRELSRYIDDCSRNFEWPPTRELRMPVARRMLQFMIMKYLKKLLILASLTSMLGACYVVERPGPRYARYECRHGYYWNGYHCHRRW